MALHRFEECPGFEALDFSFARHAEGKPLDIPAVEIHEAAFERHLAFTAGTHDPRPRQLPVVFDEEPEE